MELYFITQSKTLPSDVRTKNGHDTRKRKYYDLVNSMCSRKGQKEHMKKKKKKIAQMNAVTCLI